VTESFLINTLIYILVVLFSFLAITYYVWLKLKLNLSLLVVYFIILFLGEITGFSLLLGVLFKELNGNSLNISIVIFNLLIIFSLYIDKELSLRSLKEYFNSILLSLKSNLKLIFIPLIIIISLVLFSRTLLLATNDPLSWDDYNYHLGFIADIVESSQIRQFEYTHTFTTSFPHNYEILGYWTISIFRNDFFVESINILFLTLATLSIYLIQKKLKVAEVIARYTSIGIFAIPMILILIHSLKVDMSLSCIFTALVAIILHWNLKENLKPIKFIVIAIGIGLLIGIKTTGFLFVIALIPLIAGVILTTFHYRKDKKVILTIVKLISILSVVSTILLGSFWYIRSYIVYKNPIYPMEVNIGPIHLPGEWKDLSLLTDAPIKLADKSLPEILYFVWMEKADWYGIMYSVDSKITGTGPAWIILLFPSIIVCLIISIKNKPLLAIIGVYLIIFALSPGKWVTNYSIYLYFLGTITFGFVVNFMKSKFLKVIFISVLMFFIFLSMILTSNELYNFTYSLNNFRTLITNNTSYWASKINSYIDENTKANDVVASGSKVFFAYSLYNKNYSNKFKYIPFIDSEQEWLESLVNVKYVLIMDETPESSIVLKNISMFKEVVYDSNGPTRLYEFKGK